MALKLLPEDLSDVPSHLADRYEAQAGRYWDLFYRRNTTKFFKDRHYLHKEFPDLAAGPATLLEVGCGVGNTVFPLLEINPALKIYCCDFAASAIELVQQNPQYGASNGAVQAFVADITSNLLAAPPAEGGCGVPEGGCDLATMIFVLSAIHPQRMAAAVHNVARCLRPASGRLLFRDYAEGDLAQARVPGGGGGGECRVERLAGGDRPKRLGPNFYVRGDGTRCYYFSQPEVLALFASAGFECDSVTLHERTVVNHKKDIAMDRRWLQAIFTLREYQPPPLPIRNLLAQPAPSYTQQHQNLQQQQQQQLLHPHYQQQQHPHPHPQQQQHLQQQQREAAAGAGCVVVSTEAFPGSSGGGGASGGSGGGDCMDVDSHTGAPPAATSAVVAAAGSAVAVVAGPSSVFAPCADLQPPAASSSGLYGGSWLTGAAGRLASHLAAGPGQPSGRAMLPETLDSADDLRAELSPSPTHPQHPQHHHQHHHQQHQHHHLHHHAQHHHGGMVGGGAGGGADMQIDDHADGTTAAARRRRRSTLSSGGGGGEASDGGGGGRALESELEAEFFATIGRDSAEVVEEEVAAAGAALSRVRLVDVADMAAARLAAATPAAATTTAAATATATAGAFGGSGLHHSQQQQQQQQSGAPGMALQTPVLMREMEVPVAAGVGFRCLLPMSDPSSGQSGCPAVPAAALALSRILLASPRLLAGKCALQLGPARLLGPANAAAPAAAAASAPAPAPAAASPGSLASVSAPMGAPAGAAAVLPAMAAVRGSARRVVVSEAGREGLAAAAADLRRNAHRVVIERLRLVTLDWAAAAAADGASAAAAAAAGGGGGGVAAGYTYVPAGAVRQLRDVLQMQPSGYDIVYAVDPLAEATAAAAGGGGGAAAVAAARALFTVSGQLLAGGIGGGGGTAMDGTSEAAQGGGAAAAAAAPAAAGLRAGRQGLLLLVVPGAWAAAHGMGFAALAAVCGWELLVPVQLAELYGADVAPAAGLGCAALAFRRRLASVPPA
ncbi:hypothetical protein PLESTF_000927500 [Pleodorina starrii]|nr:hypothetical protein PLESTF_000927500 [Pleodorina starrii]